MTKVVMQGNTAIGVLAVIGKPSDSVSSQSSAFLRIAFISSSFLFNCSV